ncbi:MAG: hypothetical protein IJF73_02370 [Clostridia bacterium]|nr:hypothetical protein [Clostridia bacterium]
MKKIPVWFRFLVAVMAIELLRSPLSSLAYYLDLIQSPLAYPVYTLSRLVGLALLFATVGVAFAMAKRGLAAALVPIAATLAAFTVGGLLSLLWQALFLRLAVTPAELGALLGAAFDSVILPMLLGFFLPYAIFLSKDREAVAKGFHDFSSPPVRAALTAAIGIGLYQLVGKIITAVNFVNSYVFLRPVEIVSMTVDLLLVPAAAFWGYYLVLLARRLCLRAERAYREVMESERDKKA